MVSNSNLCGATQVNKTNAKSQRDCLDTVESITQDDMCKNIMFYIVMKVYIIAEVVRVLYSDVLLHPLVVHIFLFVCLFQFLKR